MNEQDLVDRKEADRAYHDALYALRKDHDRDLVDLMADVHEGLIDPQSLMPRKQGIANRYKHAAMRLARQYGKDTE